MITTRNPPSSTLTAVVLRLPGFLRWAAAGFVVFLASFGGVELFFGAPDGPAARRAPDTRAASAGGRAAGAPEAANPRLWRGPLPADRLHATSFVITNAEGSPGLAAEAARLIAAATGDQADFLNNLRPPRARTIILYPTGLESRGAALARRLGVEGRTDVAADTLRLILGRDVRRHLARWEEQARSGSREGRRHLSASA